VKILDQFEAREVSLIKSQQSSTFVLKQTSKFMNDYGEGRENKACGESNNEHNIG
jgi:hypothetical protein